MPQTPSPEPADTQATPTRKGLRGNPWWTLIATAIGVMMVGIDGTVVIIANPFIAEDLHASLSQLQWVTNAYLLAVAVLLIPAGKLGDRYGRRMMFLIGVAGFALTSLAVGLSDSIGLVLVFRVLQGISGAMIMPNTLALLRATFPRDELNRAVGIWGAATAIAIAGGPILGGVLVEHFGWESVFFVNIPVGILALVLGAIVLVESREHGHHRIDLPGVGLLAGSLFLIIFGVVQSQSWGWTSASTLGCILGGLVVGAIFVLVELKSTYPMLPMQIFRDRSVSIGTITVLINFFALIGVLFFITLYLQNVHGYSAIEAGVRMLPLTAVFAISSPLGGSLTGRFGPRLPIVVGLGFVSASLFGLTALTAQGSYWVLALPMLGLGIGMGLVVVASTEVIVGNTPVDLAGVAGGLQTTAVQFGGVLGTAVLGTILSSRVGSVLFDNLTASGVPTATAQPLAGAKEVVGQGLAPVPQGASPQLADAITHGSHAAFMSGLDLALLVAGMLTLGGAVLGLWIRAGRDTDDPDGVVAEPDEMIRIAEPVSI